MAEPGGFALLDDQRADQSAAELLAAHQVRVVPVAAGVLGLELVDEALARLHRRLGNVRYAVHLDRQADAVPVDGGRFVQPVGEAHPQPLALLRPQLHAGALAAIGQRRTAEARDDLQVQRRGDQFVVVLLRHLRTRQPEARTAGAEADHRQPGEAAEHLSTGKCHGAFTFGYCGWEMIDFLISQPRRRAIARATASLLIRSKRKGQPKLPFPLIGASRSFPLYYQSTVITHQNKGINTISRPQYHDKYHASTSIDLHVSGARESASRLPATDCAKTRLQPQVDFRQA